jgi:hypothetical protein
VLRRRLPPPRARVEKLAITYTRFAFRLRHGLPPFIPGNRIEIDVRVVLAGAETRRRISERRVLASATL